MQYSRSVRPKHDADLRVRRTQKHLQGALIALTLEKGYAAVTVQDLTARAMVNRSTFYRHYDTKDDLVKQCLQRLFDGIPRADLKEVAQAYPTELPPATVHFFRHIAQHAAFYKAMLTDGVPSFTEQLYANIEAGIRQELHALDRRRQADTVPLDLLPRFIASAAVGVSGWWLEQGDQLLPPEAMARAFAALVAPSVRAALGLSSK